MNTFFRLVIGVLLLVANTVAAQNLVPNGSFEEYIDCPTALDMLGTHCEGWFSSRGTCDYYNGCKATWGVSVPGNVNGYQEALTGYAYAGFINFHHADVTYREQMSIRLLDTLEIGTKYFFSMWCSNGFVLDESPNKASNGQGAYFTTIKHSSIWDEDPLDNPSLILNTPPVLYSDILLDSSNWVQVKGSFIADSAYTYVVLGGFLDEFELDTLHFGVSDMQGEAYYFVDEVRLSDDSAFAWEIIPTNISENTKYGLNTFPNPVLTEMSIQCEKPIRAIRIYDVRGKKVTEWITIHKRTFVINVSHLPKGLYFMEVQFEEGRIQIEKIIKE